MSDHVDPSVPVAAEHNPGRWPYLVLGALFLAGALSVVAWNVHLPYLAYSAGPVFDVNSSISAEDIEVFPPAGELLMLTVIAQDVNLFEVVIATFDPSIDLIEKQAVRRPGETDEEYRSRSLQQMDDSNFRSIAAALSHLGFGMVPVEVVIDGIVEGVPAEQVLELGDTIAAVRGVPVAAISEIGPLIQDLPVGERIQMTVIRRGEQLELEVELAERTDTPGVAMIGVILSEIVEPPFGVDIGSGNVGGSSAGMLHALAIIDALTEGELTAGHVIAGTGTIHPDGRVGAVGGVRQKVIAAEAAGASHILVPVENYDEAASVPRTTIEVVPVGSLAEALDFLGSLASS